MWDYRIKRFYDESYLLIDKVGMKKFFLIIITATILCSTVYAIAYSSSDRVKLGGYSTIIPASSANIGGAGNASYLGATCSATMYSGNTLVSYFRVHTFSKPENLSSFKVHVWRWGAASGEERVLTCVYMEEFISQLGTAAGWQVLTPAGDFVTTPGDVVGISYEWSDESPVNFLGFSASPAAVVLKGSGLATEPTYNWGTGSTTVENFVLPIEVWGTAPDVVHIGDSITAGGWAGYNNLGCFWGVDWAGGIFADCAYDPTVTAAYYLARHFGWGWQNKGVFGDTCEGVTNRFQKDVIDEHPRYVIISVGANDAIYGEIDPEISLGYYATMLDLCEANDIIPIVTAIFQTEFNDPAIEARIDALRESIRQLVATYPTAQYIDSRSLMEAGFTVDGGHLNIDSQILWGNDLAGRINPCVVKLFPANISKLESLMPIKFFIILGERDAGFTNETPILWDTKSIETVNQIVLGGKKRLLLVLVRIKSQYMGSNDQCRVQVGDCRGTLKINAF
jgi:lysophospholipase L1-like esterase